MVKIRSTKATKYSSWPDNWQQMMIVSSSHQINLDFLPIFFMSLVSFIWLEELTFKANYSLIRTQMFLEKGFILIVKDWETNDCRLMRNIGTKSRFIWWREDTIIICCQLSGHELYLVAWVKLTLPFAKDNIVRQILEFYCWKIMSLTNQI